MNASTEYQHARIKLLHPKDALATLQKLFSMPGNKYGWTYRLEITFAERLFRLAPPQNTVNLILDHRAEDTARQLTKTLPNFSAWSWSTNRTLHDKTFFFPHTGHVWLGTQNLNQGSFWLSYNRALVIDHYQLCADLSTRWQQDRPHAQKINPK